ncbi:hypothetical protein DFS34DRAFT_581020, partial [Phlyctochytrium arcticum]
IDFKNPECARDLACALLWSDFKLRLEIPLDSLCPPIPNRLDYVVLIEEMVQAMLRKSQETIYGIDVGTGASCIYPLLACRRNPSWKMLALDIDERTLSYAQDNINRNNLSSRVALYHSPPGTSSIIPKSALQSLTNGPFTFLMCNPPFYTSKSAIQTSRALKDEDPNGVCTGTLTEMVVEGGEVGFVTRLVGPESAPVLARPQTLFTSLLGHKSSVQTLVYHLRNPPSAITAALPHLKKIMVRRISVGRTMRWVLGWEFHFWDQKAIKKNKKRKQEDVEVGSEVPEVEMDIENNDEWDFSRPIVDDEVGLGKRVGVPRKPAVPKQLLQFVPRTTIRRS